MPSYEEDDEGADETRSEEQQPSQVQQKKKLQLKVQCQGEECQVAVSATTQFGKLFDAAYKRFNKKKGTLRFLYDDRRLQADMTPKMMEMEDGDIIDAELEQIGGALLL